MGIPTLSQVSWKLHTRDYRSAGTMLYSMLMWNADAMDYDPSLLPRPDKLPGNTPEFFHVGIIDLLLYAGAFSIFYT